MSYGLYDVTESPYSAVGDDSTVNTTAIQTAMDDANAAGGGTVVIAGGTFLSGELRGRDLVTLRIERGATLKATGSLVRFIDTATSGNGFAIEGRGTIDAAGACSSYIVQLRAGTSDVDIGSGVSFTDSAGTVGSAVELQAGCADVTVAGARFDTAGNHAVRGLGGSNIQVLGNRIRNWTQRAIYFTGTDTLAVDGLRIEGNTITGLLSGSSDPRHPIQVVGNSTNPHRRVQVRGNEVVGPDRSWTATDPGTADQISLMHCHDVVVEGNMSVDGGDVGVTVSSGCRRVAIAGNVCVGNDTAGLFVGADTVSVTGNTLANNGQNREGDRPDHSRSGLGVRNASNVSIGGNVFDDDQTTPTQRHGIRTTSSDGVRISDSNLFGDGLIEGSLLWSGTNTRVHAPSV